MKYLLARKKRGFTLVEIMTVIAIIGLLTAVVLTSVTKARQNTRDKVRLTDIKQLELTFRLYVEAFDAYPDDSAGADEYKNGVEIGMNADLSGTVAGVGLGTIQNSLPTDPKRDGSTYQYVYDTDFDCTSNGQTVIYVNNFETISSQANAVSVCGSDGGDDASSNQYIILLQ